MPVQDGPAEGMGGGGGLGGDCAAAGMINTPKTAPANSNILIIGFPSVPPSAARPCNLQCPQPAMFVPVHQEAKNQGWRAAIPMPTSDMPPHNRSIPTSSPSAQARVPGNPAMMIAA